MKYDKEINIIRHLYPNYSIWFYVEYDSKALFTISGNKQYIKNDINTCIVYVENNEVKVFDQYDAMLNDTDNYIKACNKKYFIDISKEQFFRDTNKVSSF